MNAPTIDLDGLRFRTDGRKVCAACGRDFDRHEAARVDDVDENGPLLLWRDDGAEMLTLCWAPCASIRFQNRRGN